MSNRSIIIKLLIIVLLLTACSAEAPSQSTPEPIATVRVQSDSEDTVKVGVLAIRSAEAANAQYGGIVAYLEETLARPFVLVPVTQDSQFELVESGELDFTLNNPLAAVQIQRLYNTAFLATLSRVNGSTFFSALIIVRADSDIETLEDLQDKHVTCVDQVTAAAGCIFQVFHLIENGIDPYTDFAEFSETPSQDNIVLGVLNGTFDAGFIRTGQLERMLAEGTLLSLDDIRILDQADDDFFFPHTTALYPEWPFAALENTDPILVDAVRDALLAMPEDHPAFEGIGANGFVADVDYSQLDNLVETLQLVSWDAGN
ncbi:MAG: phosphate/phosphite/phosphonate ABC transporter substrate-binding protein [Chloroflexota bacterium]